jgi:putative phosphoribosyl transferase
MRLKNREAAARLLAEKLAKYRGENPLILAIPRGAVPMGRVLADALGGELDVALVRKIGAPGNLEFAIGSVDENGEVLLSDHVWEYGIPPDYVDREARRQLAILRERRAQYTPVHTPVHPEGRLVIVLDDGVATGATLIAALRLVRKHHPRRLVAAMAVTPPQTLERVKQVADETVCLEVPRHFYAVGSFFEDFSEVTDADVIAALKPRRPVAVEAPVEELEEMEV